MTEEEKNEIKKKQLAAYLEQFWIKPTKDKIVLEFAEKFADSGVVEAVRVSSDQKYKELVQAVLLAFKHEVYWVTKSVYSLVEEYIQGDAVYLNTLEPYFLVLYSTGMEPPNKMMVPLVNGVIDNRKTRGLKTLLVTLKGNKEFIPEPQSLNGKSSIGEIV